MLRVSGEISATNGRCDINRDLSPAAYVAPGTASIALALILAAASPDPLPLDVWISNYSPNNDQYVNLTVVAGTGNQITVPTDGNARYFIFIPPRGNTATITLKGLSADTGIALNPNGPILLSLPATGQPTYILLVTSAAITGARVIWL